MGPERRAMCSAVIDLWSYGSVVYELLTGEPLGRSGAGAGVVACWGMLTYEHPCAHIHTDTQTRTHTHTGTHTYNAHPRIHIPPTMHTYTRKSTTSHTHIRIHRATTTLTISLRVANMLLHAISPHTCGRRPHVHRRPQPVFAPTTWIGIRLNA